MTRHETPDDTLDPRELAELDALEAALAGGTSDPEWAALVAAVRDEPPVAGDRAQASLDARVAAGFPRRSRRPAWLRVPAREKLLPALAVASTLVIGGVVVGTGALGGGGRSDAIENLSTVAPYSAQGSPSRKADAVPPGQRSVERTATVELTTGARKLQNASDRIIRATQDLGGVVERSTVDGGPRGGSADFTLRVPSARLGEALKRFGEIANVSRLSQGAQDITGAVVSRKDRLSDARTERQALRKALGKAEREATITSLRTRIRINRVQIAQLEGDLRSLARRSDLATVQVSLSARGKQAAAPADGGDSWGPGAAAHTALRVLEVAAGVLVVAAAILAPLALLVALFGFGGRAVRRRRREGALGGA